MSEHSDGTSFDPDADRRYAELVASIDGIVWEADARTFQFTFVSSQAERLLGYPLDQWLKPGFWVAHVHSDDRDRAVALCQRATREHRKHDFEYRMIAADGRAVWLRDIVTVVDAGEAVRLRGIMVDIMERKRTEEALLESQERLRLAVQATNLGPWDWDLRTNTVDFSPEWKRQLGYEPHEITSRYEEWETRLHPDDREAMVEALRGYLEGRRPEYAVEFRLRHKDGSFRWIYTRGLAVRDASGTVTHMLGCHLDITERKRAEALSEQFRQAQKMEAVGRLAGGVAHDFNNLLTVINAYSELVFDSLRPDDANREWLAEIRKSGERAANLTRQLLAFSRSQVLQPQVVSLNALLDDLLKLLGRLIGEDIELILAPEPALGLAKVDPGQFEQAIMNLSVNARDAMPQGGRLTIETRNVELSDGFVAQNPEVRPGPYVLVALTDTGHGMDEATAARIFDPFFTTKGPGQGTGLGLAMVYGFVKQSEGHIEVDTEPAHGATFRIYLPQAADATPAPKSSAGTLQTPRGTETVLLVEDEDAVRAIARLILQSRGYTVLEARDGQEAVRVAQQHTGPIHLLVADLVMPRMGGRQLADLLIRDRPQVRLLFVSGYTEEGTLQHRAPEAGVAFLQKPFSPIGLARKVREVLDAIER